MSQPTFPDAVLVAVDFSPCSVRALDTAISWRRKGTDITVLHVVDTDLARNAEQTGIGAYEEAIRRMRAYGENELSRIKQERAGVALETMLVEGVPFVEIVKLANDLECALIVLGNRGTGARLTQLLFGNTAERVLRAATQPVLCVP